MQATLPARPKTIIDMVPRSEAPAARSRRDARPDDFANKLAEVRADRVTNAPADPKPAKVDETAKAKPKDAEPDVAPKPTAKAKSKENASEQPSDGEAQDSSTTDAAKPASKPEDAAADGEADASVEEATAPSTPAVKKAAPEIVIDPAVAGTVPVVAAPNSTTDEIKKSEDASASNVDAAEAGAIVAAVAAQVVVANDGANVAVAGEDSADAVPDAMADASNALKPATPETAPKNKPAGDAKMSDATDLPQEAIVGASPNAATAHNNQDDAQRDAEQEAPASATAGKDATQAATNKKVAESTFDAMLAKLTPPTPDEAKVAPTPVAPAPQQAASPEHRFAADNVDKVVTSVRSQINAGGNGEMRIRLDPPELGALEVAVKMIDGRMTASFTTNNDEATQLLSHSLGNLKNSLESSGINVDRIQVRQASPSENAQQQPSNGEHRREGGNSFDQPSQRGDQQRKDAVEKMWRKLAYGSDELDFVA